MHIKMHRPLPENAIIKSATIRQTSTGKYQIAILVEHETEITFVRPVADKVIGLDYSSQALYVDSEGNKANYPRFYRLAEEKLKKAQRKLSKKKIDSKNREKLIKLFLQSYTWVLGD